MEDKLSIFEVMKLIDQDSKWLWSEVSEEQQKAIKNDLYILNRWISSVNSNNREIVEHFVLATNEYYNKNWNDLSKHPELQWKLLCMCAHDSKSTMKHAWIANKKRTGNNKISKFLETLYPNKKSDEIELQASLMTLDDAKELARLYGYDESQIKKIL
jgi:hypothetical protein